MNITVEQLERLFQDRSIYTFAGIKGMSTKDKLAIFRLVRFLESERKTIAQTNDSLLKEYGDALGDGRFQIAPDRIQEYTKTLKELKEQVIEIPIEKPFELTEQHLSELSSLDLINLEHIITIKEKP